MRVCVIGGGESGISLVKYLREATGDLDITLIDKREYYFSRDSVIPYCCGNEKMNVVPLDDFCQKYSVKFLSRKVEKINPRKRKVFLKGDGSLEFDVIVLCTGAKSKDLSIRGDFREGFFYLSDINPSFLRDLVKVSHDIIVYTTTFLGIQLTFHLATLGKDIKFISQDLSFLSGREEEVLTYFKSRGVDVYCGCTIEEVIGEGMVKATRVSLPKIFSSQLVLVDSGFLPEWSMFEEPLNIRDTFFTEYEGIYVLGEANNMRLEEQRFFIYNSQRAREQAEVLARYMTDNCIPAYEETKRPFGEDKEVVLKRFLESISASSY